MFYSQFILAKKGPLGTIWIAAHLERKLRKNQVADTDIGVSVDSILFPDVPIALRLSSHLLLGVVRIYSRKVNYLFHDCSEALLKVKQAFRSTAVDLPPEESTAPYHSITLPETFDLDDFELPDSENFQGNYVDHHISTREQITLQDTMDGVVYSTSQFGLDERFGDGDASQIGLDLDEELLLDKIATPGHTAEFLDKDDACPHESGQPMTPFTIMEINDDGNRSDEDGTAETSEVLARVAKSELLDFSHDQNVAGYASPLCGSRIYGPALNGKSFSSEHGDSKELSECAPSTPRLVEQVVLPNGHLEDPISNVLKEAPVSTSLDVIMQDVNCSLQLESECCSPMKLVAGGSLENRQSYQDTHMKDINNTGNFSLLKDKSLETDVLYTSNEESVEASLVMPTTVLAEQSKPTFPVSVSLAGALAVPDIRESAGASLDGVSCNKRSYFSDPEQTQEESGALLSVPRVVAASSTFIMERAESSQNEFCRNERPNSLDAEQAQAESGAFLSIQKDSAEASTPPYVVERTEASVDGVISMKPNSSDLEQTEAEGVAPGLAPQGISLNTGRTSSLAESLDNPLSSIGGISMNRMSSNNCSSTSARSDLDVASNKSFFEQQTLTEIFREGDLHPSYSSNHVLPCHDDSLSRKINADELDKLVAKADTENTSVHNHVGLDAKTDTHGHVLQACSSHTNKTNLVLLGDGHIGERGPVSIEPGLCPLEISGMKEPLHPFGTLAVPGEECHPPRVGDTALEATNILELFPRFSNSDGSLENAISKISQADNSSVSTSSDFPFPAREMMLSAPVSVGDAHSDLLIGSTIEKEVPTDREVSGDVSNILSERKRPYMDSTPIVQDRNSAKLSGMPKRKRTMDSIPDDNDLLSSILVGRRSSGLKFRPTPRSLEGQQPKRPRATPRVNVPKRKVLMDDTLVLHGDTIRQQLTSTEDIRRIRKKAPCTRPEIWTIQKHLLEDEVFTEPLFTGMSVNLIGLHSRITEFKVSTTDMNHKLLEIENRIKLRGSTDPVEETCLDRMGEPAIVGNDGEAHETAETPAQIVNQLFGEHHDNTFVRDTQKQTDALDHVSPPHLQTDGHIRDDSRIGIDEQDNRVVDIADHAGTPGVECMLVDAPVIREGCSVSVNSLSESLPVDIGNQAETISQNERQLDVQFVEKDVCTVDETNYDADKGIVVGESSALAEGDSTAKDNSITQKVSGCSLIDVVPQSSVRELQVDGCGLTSDECVSVAKHESAVQKGSESCSVTVMPQNFTQEGDADICGPVDRCCSTFTEGASIARDDSAIQNESASVDVVSENITPESEVDVNRPALAEAVPIEKEEYLVQKISESGSVSVAPHNFTKDHNFDMCGSPFSPKTAPGDNVMLENRSNVLLDASTSLENVKSSFTNISGETGGPIDLTVATEDVAEKGFRSELGIVSDDEFPVEVRDDEAISSTKLVTSEKLQTDPLDVNQDADNVAPDVGKELGSEEKTKDAETVTLDHGCTNATDEFRSTLGGNHTEFLNFDDDEEDEEGDASIPFTEETGLLDTSGWSSRTRGVARYLQTLFDDESGHERKVLPMDKLLSGKTRKEASRMFFETLVLKTRDYIQVEQDNPFTSICIKPTGKLMKSDF